MQLKTTSKRVAINACITGLNVRIHSILFSPFINYKKNDIQEILICHHKVNFFNNFLQILQNILVDVDMLDMTLVLPLPSYIYPQLLHFHNTTSSFLKTYHS